MYYNMNTQQTELTRNEFIKKFDSLPTKQKTSILSKAGLTKKALNEQIEDLDMGDLTLSDIAIDINDGQEIISNLWDIMNEGLRN